jgi:putative ABC transport system permease protein
MFMAVRASSDVLALLPAVRQAVFEVDETIPVSDVRSMDEVFETTMAGSRFNALLVGLLAVIALVLVTTGIYGVVAYYIAQHSREIGIRMAIGAGRSGTVRHVVLRGLRPASIGVGIGLMTFLAGTSLLRGFLFGIQPYDPTTLLGSVGFLLLLGVLASLIPAITASRLNIVEIVAAQ